MPDAQLLLEQDGAEAFRNLLTEDAVSQLEQVIGPHGTSAGVRIFGNPALERWLADSAVSETVAKVLGPSARPVRAILFDKTAAANWTLGWHQDRTIAVRNRVDQAGFDHWNIKSGAAHVEPPFAIIERMLTARIHIDAVGPVNSPLLIAPGSHRLGRIEESEIDEAVARCGTAACLAGRGDVWLYRTAILHASERSRSEASRRVLQVDFSNEALPGALEWLGIS